MKLRFLLIAILGLTGVTVQAQNDVTISDEELQRYVTMMDSIEHMRINLVAELTTMVRNNENITIARYNELYKLSGDETKLKAANASPEEIAILEEIRTRKDTGTAAINETYKVLAKDYVGASTYNKIRKAITSDVTLKAKYDTLLNRLKSKDERGG